MSVLADLLERLRPQSDQPRVMVFDLDSTLFSTQKRNHAILQEFARDVGAPRDFYTAFEKLTADDLGWNIMEDLRSRGFRHEPTLTRLRQFWFARFFRDEYLHHDEPLAGAVDFVTAAYEAGATIYYLTGRDEPNMGKGTRKSLESHNFPLLPPRVHLRLKPRFEDEDLAFKRDTIDEIRTLGQVVGVFENEPVNANLFHQAFPEATVVFLETVHSPNPPPLADGIVRLPNFLR